MSGQSFEDFLQAILDDADLQEQLKTQIDERRIETSYGLANLAVEMGGERGYGFSHEDARISIDEMIAVAHRDAELSNQELELVAGGAGPPLGGDHSAGRSGGLDLSRTFDLKSFRIGR